MTLSYTGIPVYSGLSDFTVLPLLQLTFEKVPYLDKYLTQFIEAMNYFYYLRLQFYKPFIVVHCVVTFTGCHLSF